MNPLGSRSFKDIANQSRARLKHSFKAQATKGYGVHSPMLYHLITDIIGNLHSYYAYERLERIRNKLKWSKKPVQAGTHGSSASAGQTTFGQIIRQTAMPPEDAQLIFRLVNYYQPENLLELGTGPGLTTAYIGCAMPKGSVTSVEGNGNLTGLAAKVMRMAGVNNVHLMHTNFSKAIKAYTQKHKRLDFLVIDGDHTYEATMNYYTSLASLLHEKSVVVLHDIHWSVEMEKAWYKITTKPDVKVVIDCFSMGILLYHKALPSQYLRLKV